MTSQEARVNATTLAGLRMAAGLSQAEVADRINATIGSAAVTANAVSRWERGTVTPTPMYRRALASLFGVTIDDLGLQGARGDHLDDPHAEVLSMDHTQVVDDPRVVQSQDQWRATRRALNASRAALTRLAVGLYPGFSVGDTGLIAPLSWIPLAPVDLADITLIHSPDSAAPLIDGTEVESAHVRPSASLTRPYGRYTQAIRDLDHPRLFENRPCWRLMDAGWDGGRGVMNFGDTSFFAAVDVNEVTAHEMAYVHLNAAGVAVGPARLRDLPFRRLVGSPFDLTRRPVVAAISTLTIRGGDQPTFILHRRDSKSVAMAGGMLQVIPSGIFQASSVLPAVTRTDFDLWRNVQREYAEELLGHAEHDGDGQPISYDVEPFAAMDAARAEGRIRIHCLGVALDALTLVAEILTVAVIDPDVFDVMARDFVEVNDEGTVVNERLPFSPHVVASVIASGRAAPAGAGCLDLAMRHWEVLRRPG